MDWWRLTKLEWLRSVFSSRWKVISDGAARMADSRLFHTGGSATGNDHSPKVDFLLCVYDVM